MDDVTRARLLELNRDFYAKVARPFDETRQARTPGKIRLVDWIGARQSPEPVRVLDVGCGNGRLALMLDDGGRAIDYVGVDGEAQLLTAARHATAGLAQVHARFLLADLAQEAWWRELPPGHFDVVTCLATLQHMPGYALRQRLVIDLARLAAPGGVVVVSAWQFLESDRLRGRRLDWAAIGIDEAATEPGDALLPWKQGVYAVRYVHQIDAVEMARLAADSGLQMLDHYRADGREGNLNLYAMLQKPDKTISSITAA
jgi:2-polyprenyl-3-methyl-5-hydroxy-6-metoxy-1,4-benzoquinol methylase